MASKRAGNIKRTMSSKRTKENELDQNVSTELNLGQKMEILALIDKEVPYSKISLQYGCGKGTITRIKQKRPGIQDAWDENKATSSKSSTQKN